MPLKCCFDKNCCTNAHRTVCHNIMVEKKLEQLDRLDKIRNANGRLRNLIKQVDDLTKKTEQEVNTVCASAEAYLLCETCSTHSCICSCCDCSFCCNDTTHRFCMHPRYGYCKYYAKYGYCCKYSHYH
jgi:hypothetical protein